MAHHKSVRYLTQTELRYPVNELLQGLRAIHQAGFIHNNINPRNILINESRSGSISVVLDGFKRCSKVGHQVEKELGELDTKSLLHQAPEVIASGGAKLS